MNYDAKVAERLVADDYFAVNSDGSTSDKAMAVAIARSNEKVDIKEEDMKMRLYNNTAVCTYKLFVMTNPNDKRSLQKARIAKVWVKRKAPGN